MPDKVPYLDSLTESLTQTYALGNTIYLSFAEEGMDDQAGLVTGTGLHP